ETLRHDADDREGLAVDPQLLADGRRVAAELRLPERVTEDHFLVVADLAVFLTERAAERGAGTEKPEKRRPHAGYSNADWRAALVEVLMRAVVDRLFLEDVGLAQAVVVIRHA